MIKKSKNLLIKGLNKHEKINKLKTKENDELKNEIRELKKSNKQFTGLPTILQDVKKRDNKARTLVPPDNTTESTKIIDLIKSADKDEKELKLILKLLFNKRKIPKDFDIDKLLEDENKYLDINLGDVNNLFDTIKRKC